LAGISTPNVSVGSLRSGFIFVPSFSSGFFSSVIFRPPPTTLCITKKKTYATIRLSIHPMRPPYLPRLAMQRRPNISPLRRRRPLPSTITRSATTTLLYIAGGTGTPGAPPRGRARAGEEGV
uniref:Uncharacterized protein n=1 Tax=Aegilops tauschii subsp. strangulata TaxID=200361 RepID=A0A453BNN6_AEGTS